MLYATGKIIVKQVYSMAHCVTTEKVPAKYRSLKMADASLGKWSIFNDCGGIASTRHWISVHRGKKSAWKRFRILVQSHEALQRLYETLEGPVQRERYRELLVDGSRTVLIY